MAKITGSKSVPKVMRPTYDAVVTLTDMFCREHLDESYRELAQRMTASLCRKPVSSEASRRPSCRDRPP